MLLLFISFFAGVLTVLAPCTISLLPVIVGGTLSGAGGRKSSFIVVASLGMSVILFTLILKVSTLFINIPQSFWQIFSGTIIFILGFVMLFPSVWESIPLVGKLNLSGNRLLATGYKKQNFAGDIIMGAALGPVFSTCSPTYFLILATVLPRNLGAGVIYLLAYVAGLCGFLLIISILSQKVIGKLGYVSDNRGWLKRTIGVIFLILGFMIMLGYDQKIELALSSQIFDVTTIEQKFLADQAMNKNSTAAMDNKNSENSTETGKQNVAKDLDYADRIKIKSSKYELAPEITNPSGFINTDGHPISLEQYRGKKVVLVDFWTYSCINCQRTIPYLNAWYKKYADQGLEIVGVHTPEFAFEHVFKNVQDGVSRFGIKYPVVLDNDYATWDAFNNQYWPREYLIDIDGFIVHNHAGEGAYDETEQAIQEALSERADVLQQTQTKISGGKVNPVDVVSMDPNKVGSPETYFGSNRNEYLANGQKGTLGIQYLSTPPAIELNKLYLSGTWDFDGEYAETQDKNAKIIYKYDAKNLYFVGSGNTNAMLKILLDGKLMDTNRGKDVKTNGVMSINENRLYEIVNGTDYGIHTLEIDVINGTLDAYTFTFG